MAPNIAMLAMLVMMLMMIESGGVVGVGIEGGVMVDAVVDPCPGGTMAMSMQLISCSAASKSTSVPVSEACCKKVRQIGQNPACLCSCVSSNAAKAAGIDPKVALTIPKRCNITPRPIGYKCAGGTLP